MSLFKGGPKLWSEIRARANSTRGLVACVGYVGRNPEKVLKWRKGDKLVADISHDTVSRGLCSARGALKLLMKGVHVYQSPGLHAKIYLFDATAIVCSANASETSLNARREAGVVLSGQDVAPVRSWIGGVMARSDTLRLDGVVLKALARAEPKQLTTKRTGKSSEKTSAHIWADTVWLLNASDYDDETKTEEDAADAFTASLVRNGTLEDDSDIQWFCAVAKSVYDGVRPGDDVVWGGDVEPYYPHGSLEGPFRCITPVDLGSRFGWRRYRLALSGARVRKRKLSENDFKSIKKVFGMSAVPGFPVGRKGNGRFRSIASRVLGL